MLYKKGMDYRVGKFEKGIKIFPVRHNSTPIKTKAERNAALHEALFSPGSPATVSGKF
jgi:hypothetical protein